LRVRGLSWRQVVLLLARLATLFSPNAFAVTGGLELTSSAVGFIAVAIFVLAYALVMAEEKLHMRKSKPVLVAAGLIWVLIGWVYVQAGCPDEAQQAFRAVLLEFTE